MTPFRERNPVVIGFVGFAVIATMLIAAFRADKLPIIGGGDTYHAQFTEIGGLRGGDEVRIAGVTVGKVDKIELAGDVVNVTFRIRSKAEFGTDTGAEVRIRTLLGATFMALTPAGQGQLKEGSTIPVSRTVAPYDVVQAFSDLSTTIDTIDVDQLSAALETLADIARETPEEFRGAIDGLSDVSRNLAARDAEINTLLVSLKKVTGVLNSRNTELETLFRDSAVLFDAVASRRDSIHRLLVASENISTELSALVKQSRADLKPALDQLDKVTALLRQNKESLDETLRVAPAFFRVFTDSLGSGPWFDAYLGGVPPNLGLADQVRSQLPSLPTPGGGEDE